MIMLESFEIIQKYKIIAVIRTDQKDEALNAAHALLEGGIKIIEISLLTPDGLDAISKLKDEDVFVGAGTVMNKEMALQAVKSGAKFIVSPYINEQVIRVGLKNNVLVSAGCVTPNEIIRAKDLGVHLIKIFPAHGFGGVEYLKSLMDVFPKISFMPTGGVNEANLSDYLKIGVTAVGMSSSLTPKEDLSNRNYEKLTQNAREICRIIQ